MLTTVLTMGSVLGAVLGAAHAAGVFRSRIRSGASARRPEAAYAAAWTFVLWTLFGSYVLILWLVSVPLWAGRRLLVKA